MVSVQYLKSVMDAFRITQKDLTEEWSRLRKDGKKKHQSNISLILEKDYVDSVTMLKAIENLSGVPIHDLANELSWDVNNNTILYSVSEPPSAYGVSNNIPVLVNSKKIGMATLPTEWMKKGINKISQANIAGMNFNQNDFIGSVLVSREDWGSITNYNVYELVLITGETFVKRIRMNPDNTITCISDQESNFPRFDVSIDQIKELWEVCFKISWEFNMPSHLRIENEMDDMRSVMNKMYQEIKKMKQ